jgi:uncharacterized protein DUF4236
MGWSFRRSVGVGPIRFNFTKRGVGLSAGVKGVRFGTSARGQQSMTLSFLGFVFRLFRR